jgi:UrcA family protein
MKTSLILAAALTAVSALPVAAGAQQTRTVEVRYGDLDLSADAAVNQLKSRVARAARSICINSAVRDLATRNIQQACYRAALEEANRDVEVAVLEARSQMLARNDAGRIEIGRAAVR